MMMMLKGNKSQYDSTLSTHSAPFLCPMSNTSDGTVLLTLNLTSVPGCALNIVAVATVVVVSWRWCLKFLLGRPFPSLENVAGTLGISGTLSDSSEAVELCVMRNCDLRRCVSTRVDCWSTQELMVRKRGTEERDVMKLSRPMGWLTVSREGSWGVWGALELVQLKRLGMPTPGPGRWDMEGRLERNWRNVGGGGRGRWSVGGSGYTRSEASPSRDRVLRVEALPRTFWMGRTGEDGVALSFRRCEFDRERESS